MTPLQTTLSQKSDQELINYYNELQEQESADYQMDGSGELGSEIAETWNPIWEAFESEFNKRDINL